MIIETQKEFERSYKKILAQYPKLKEKIQDMIRDFSENVYDSQYFRKNFSYKGRIITELQFWGDWRCLCEVIVIEDKIYLLNIGSHSSLELSSRKRVRL